MSQSPIDMLSIRESWRMLEFSLKLSMGLKRSVSLDPVCPFSVPPGSSLKTPLYAEGETIAKLLVESGYGVITGGGPGLMEAGNKGATEAGGTSVGLHIQLPHEQECNKYVKDTQ